MVSVFRTVWQRFRVFPRTIFDKQKGKGGGLETATKTFLFAIFDWGRHHFVAVACGAMQAWLRSREANGAVRVSGRPSTSIASTSTYSLHRALARRRWLSLRLAPPSRAPAVSAVERCHKGPVNSLDVDRVDSRFLLSGGADASIHIFDLGMADNAPAGAFGENLSSAAQIPGKVRPLASINKSVGGTGHKFSITGVNWYPLDTGLFTSSSMDCTIKIWDTNSLESVCSFALGHRVHSHALPPHPGAHALIAAATEAPQIRLCDMRSGAFTHTLAADFVGGHISSVLTVAWSPLNEHQLASGSRDKSIRLWDIRKAKSCVTTFDQHRTVQAIDPQSQSTHPQSTERKSAQRSGSTASMPSITAHAHTAAVNGVVFTSDGINILSTGHDECIRLWNAETGLNTLFYFTLVIIDKS
ncbi:WD40-repeat-containing domain protein [Zopfochytrium polystomum]|nr:WD40-repeat-containing domain protein [Zopfochytrium polystomum]